MELVTPKTPAKVLWIYWKVYGFHCAGIEICDRAINVDQMALPHAEKIWAYAKAQRRLV